MSLTVPHKFGHVGTAPKSVLTVLLGGSTGDLTVTCNNLTGWPTGAGSRPFVAVIGRGTASEEKILCSSRAGNVLTVMSGGTNGRAFDGTTITSHAINDEIEHVWSAVEADLLANFLGLMTAKGDLLGMTGAGVLERIPVGADGTNLVADSTQPLGVKWGGKTISDKASSYTLVLTDSNSMIRSTGSSNINITIPTNASVGYPIGTQVDIYRSGTGTVTIVPAGGVTIRSRSGLLLAGQYAVASVTKVDTNEWLAVGALST